MISRGSHPCSPDKSPLNKGKNALALEEGIDSQVMRCGEYNLGTKINFTTDAQ